jgi:transcriptional regulator with XRE-family HTH domain
MTIAERIQERREEIGMTRFDLAHAMTAAGRDTREADVWRWETGGNAPNLESAKALARALNTSIDSLLGAEAEQ